MKRWAVYRWQGAGGRVNRSQVVFVHVADQLKEKDIVSLGVWHDARCAARAA